MKLILPLLLTFCCTISISQVDFESSNLPILMIETNGQEIEDDPKITAILKVLDSQNGMNHVGSNDFRYNGAIGIEIRGNTSQGFPKKSYGFETRDEFGENANVSLLNLPVENDWILYAPYTDKSLMRNVLAFDLALKSGHYASRTVFCELLINEEYMGVYVLMEKLKRDKNRVDISKLNPDENSGEDLSGGYIIKIDNPTGTFCETWSPLGANYHIQYEYPSCDTISVEQKAYIKNYILDFENALHLFESNADDRSYLNYVDENSIIDYFLINEVTKNIDAYMLSSFLYKDKNGKLNFGPIWDYNLCFGNAEIRKGYETDGFQSDINEVPWWWGLILSDSIIQSKTKVRWCDLRTSTFSTESIFKSIDSLTYYLEDAQERNFEKWPIEGVYIWPSHFVSSNFEDEVYYLKDWVKTRLVWMDEALDCKSNIEDEINFYPNPFTESFNCTIKLTEEKNASAYLYALNGKIIAQVLEESTSTSPFWYFHWDATHLQEGVYYLQIKLDQEIFKTIKVIKM